MTPQTNRSGKSGCTTTEFCLDKIPRSGDTSHGSTGVADPQPRPRCTYPKGCSPNAR
jgi:hypothetical protein